MIPASKSFSKNHSKAKQTIKYYQTKNLLSCIIYEIIMYMPCLNFSGDWDLCIGWSMLVGMMWVSIRLIGG
jgi:hypothetical protein